MILQRFVKGIGFAGLNNINTLFFVNEKSLLKDFHEKNKLN